MKMYWDHRGSLNSVTMNSGAVEIRGGGQRHLWWRLLSLMDSYLFISGGARLLGQLCEKN